jgi:hypothetical protein
MPSPVPVPSPAMSVPPAPGLTDYLTGWGTIALAVVTFLTVYVTVRMARTDRRRDNARRAEDREEAKNQTYARQLAQARLVITGAPEISPPSLLGNNWNRYEVHFSFANYGDRPVIGIEADVWVEGAPLDKPCTDKAEKERYLLPGGNLTLEVVIRSPAPELRLGAWRIRWTDADGREWCVDQPQQPQPLPYEGQLPRPC